MHTFVNIYNTDTCFINIYLKYIYIYIINSLYKCFTKSKRQPVNFSRLLLPLPPLPLSLASWSIPWKYTWVLYQGWREVGKLLTFLHLFISFTYSLFQLFNPHLAGHYFPSLKKGMKQISQILVSYN